MRLDWFKFYPSDFLNSPDVMMMVPAARGCYITLLGRCWLNAKNGGGVPNKTDYILSVCNCTEKEWALVKDCVLSKFEKRDGQLFNPRIMDEIKEAQDLSNTKKENAQSGWETRRIASAMLPQSIRNANGGILDKKVVDTEKESEKSTNDFKNISVQYRAAMGRGHSKSKVFRDKYSAACREFGEDSVLAVFEEWAESNKWRNENLGNTGLRFFFSDLSEMIDEKKAVESLRPKGAVVSSEEQQKIIAADHAQAELVNAQWAAKIQKDEKDSEEQKANPLAF